MEKTPYRRISNLIHNQRKRRQGRIYDLQLRRYQDCYLDGRNAILGHQYLHGVGCHPSLRLLRRQQIDQEFRIYTEYSNYSILKDVRCPRLMKLSTM